MATPRQIESARRNALKSTGPRSEPGKLAARRNALRHGAASAGDVYPENLQPLIDERLETWAASFPARDDHDAWRFRQMVVASVLADQALAHERSLLNYEAERAVLAWERDRTAAAEDLAAGLAKDPRRVAARLKTSKHGCTWLIETWGPLIAALEANDGWTAEQYARALDLLGVAPELRDGPTPLLPAGEADPRGFALGVARGEVAALERSIAEGLEELDRLAQQGAASGFATASGAELRRVRRYAAEQLRRVEEAREYFRSIAPAEPEPEPEPQPDPEPQPAPPPEAPPAPPATCPPPSSAPSRPMWELSDEEIKATPEFRRAMASYRSTGVLPRVELLPIAAGAAPASGPKPRR